LFKIKNKLGIKTIFFTSLIIIFSISILFFQKKVKSDHLIKTKLITSVHKDLPFKFVTQDKSVVIKPGEVKTLNYSVENLSNNKETGMATFQVYPSELKDYITKMNCFCYEEQTLKAGEKEKYALVLLVDPNVTKNIKEAIIQFVFFKK
jgi:cytochrome c oxidase assembly protein subunit 11|tara:strand:- start:399 stop:845 length:447 start_codon:yes stop_codon:yes gene_type:complete